MLIPALHCSHSFSCIQVDDCTLVSGKLQSAVKTVCFTSSAVSKRGQSLSSWELQSPYTIPEVWALNYQMLHAEGCFKLPACRPAGCHLLDQALVSILHALRLHHCIQKVLDLSGDLRRLLLCSTCLPAATLSWVTNMQLALWVCLAALTGYSCQAGQRTAHRSSAAEI